MFLIGAMAKLDEIVELLDEELKTSEIPDYPGAHNGLQLQNGGAITKVGAAVDASLPVIQKAIDQEVDLLLVHHGMFWQGVRPVTGAGYHKLKLAMDAGLAIYSSHIPLDVHPSHGNMFVILHRRNRLTHQEIPQILEPSYRECCERAFR